MLRVFVALGKQLPKNKAMIEDTEMVGKMLAKYNCTLVQGGARIGLMGTVLNEFQKYSDEVVLIVPEVHKDDLKGTSSREHYIVEGEADRLKITINTCDLIVVLPGGTGTMAELNYYNETCKSGEHNAKIVMINTKGFYNKLFKFIKHQTKVGFMKKEDFKFEVLNNANQLEPIIRQLIAEKQAKIQQEQIEENNETLMEEAEEVADVEVVKPTKASKPATKNKVAKTEDKTPKSRTTKTATTKEHKIKAPEAKTTKTKAGATKTATSKAIATKTSSKTTAKVANKSTKTDKTSSAKSKATASKTTKKSVK